MPYCDPEQYLYSIEQSFCSNNEGGGGGGGIETPQCPPGTSPPAQPTPPPPTGPPVEMELREGKKIIRFVQGGDGNCVVNPPQDIINKVKDPCLKAMVDAVINKDVTTVINGIIQKVFGGSTKINISYVDVDNLSAGQEGYTPPPSSLDPNGNLTITVNLNVNSLPNYSKEFIATVIMHESLHAYLTTIGIFGQLQHEAIATVFANQMALDLQQMFPDIDPIDAKYLAWGGLKTTDDYKKGIGADLSQSGQLDATQASFSVGTKGSRCNK